MKTLFATLLVCSSLLGCSTSSNVVMGNPGQTKTIHTVAFAPKGGNSADMDSHIERDLLSRGIEVKATATPSARKAADVDAVVSYSDKWNWDMAMYLKSLDLNIFDAKSGSLLVTGHWENSLLHGFQDPAAVIKQVMDEIFQKLGSARIEKTAEANH